jgi:hypothetical protein
VTKNCRGYDTPSLRGIPFASQYAYVSLTRGKMKISRRSKPMLVLTISKISNISYDQSHVWVRAWSTHSLIQMSNIKHVAIMSAASIFNDR